MLPIYIKKTSNYGNVQINIKKPLHKKNTI